MEHSSTAVLRGLKKENRAPFKDSVLKESRRATLRIWEFPKIGDPNIAP